MKKILLILALLVTPLSALDFGLIWDAPDPVEQISGYNLYEKTVSATNVPTYTLVTTILTPMTTVELKAVSNAKHTYVVTAFNDLGESAYSNECVVSPVPGSPRNLRIKMR